MSCQSSCPSSFSASFTLALALVSSLALASNVACSKSGGDSAGGVAKLTPEQMQRFQTTVENVKQVTDWSGEKTADGDAKVANMASAAPTVSVRDQAKGNLLSLVLDPKNCKITSQTPKVGGDGPEMGPEMGPDFNIKLQTAIEGAQCPISFSFGMNHNQKVDPATGNISTALGFSLKYAAIAPEAQQLDVTSYTLNFTAEASGNVETGIKGGAQGSGEIVSRTQGKIKITVGGPMVINKNGGTAISTMLLTYPEGLAVELKEVITFAGGAEKPSSTKYYINGQEIEKSEFVMYSAGLGTEKLNRAQE